MPEFPLSRPWLYQHARLVLLGLLTGLLAVTFRYTLEAAERLRPWLMHWVGEGGLALLASVLLSILFVTTAVWLVHRYCPEGSGSGIPQVKALALHPAPIRWFRLLLVKFSGGVLAIGGGLTLGREGPTVQMGAALGELLGSTTNVDPGNRRQLLILGAGAGLAGAFNAPLAGTLFILEELGEQFHPRTCFAALLTTFSSDLVCRMLSGPQPQLGSYAHTPPDLALLPCFLLLGWLGGVLGVVFNQTLLLTLSVTDWIRGTFGFWVTPLLISLVVGLLGWLNPDWVGGGHGIFKTLSGGEIATTQAIALLVMRFLLTISSYSTGTPGGLFAPLLILGALLGQSMRAGVAHPDAFAFMIVGMAALFTGIVRAPMTGILLVIEMAGAYSLLPFLLGAVLVARFTADALADQPIYDALLERQQRLEH